MYISEVAFQMHPITSALLFLEELFHVPTSKREAAVRSKMVATVDCHVEVLDALTFFV